MKRDLVCLGAFVCASLVTFSSAHAREEGASASSLGLADAVRSSATGTSALYFNPAAMHQFMQYAIDAGYQYNQPLNGHVVSVGIVDSATNELVAAGIGYSYLTGHEFKSETDRDGHFVRGGLASGYRWESFSLHAGIGLRYLDLTVGESGSATGFTMDAGLLMVYQNMLRFGIVGHNLIETELSEAPRRMGLGVSFLYSSLLIGFDAVLDFESLDETEAQYNVGLEYAIAGRVPLRVGYTNDRITGAQRITGGIGYVSRIVAVDFGFSQNLDDEKDNIFSLNTRFFIP